MHQFVVALLTGLPRCVVVLHWVTIDISGVNKMVARFIETELKKLARTFSAYLLAALKVSPTFRFSLLVPEELLWSASLSAVKLRHSWWTQRQRETSRISLWSSPAFYTCWSRFSMLYCISTHTHIQLTANQVQRSTYSFWISKWRNSSVILSFKPSTRGSWWRKENGVYFWKAFGASPLLDRSPYTVY